MAKQRNTAGAHTWAGQAAELLKSASAFVLERTSTIQQSGLARVIEAPPKELEATFAELRHANEVERLIRDVRPVMDRIGALLAQLAKPAAGNAAKPSTADGHNAGDRSSNVRAAKGRGRSSPERFVLTAQGRLLMVLAQRIGQGQSTHGAARDLRAAAGLSAVAFAKTVSTLVARGYISRVPGEKMGLATYSITAAGQDAIAVRASHDEATMDAPPRGLGHRAKRRGGRANSNQDARHETRASSAAKGARAGKLRRSPHRSRATPKT